MKIIKNKKKILVFLLLCINLSTLIACSVPTTTSKDNNLGSLKTSATESGGKEYTTLSTTIRDCYINNEQPGLNRLPEIDIANSILSNARLIFEDIFAHNYTYDLEPEFTERYKSRSPNEPTYVYQKFWIESSQVINNVSIFIEDEINENLYDEKNSWAVAILNCSNDQYGTPFINGTIQEALVKPHPRNDVPHWEHFDFLNSEIGPIYLDIDNTNYTDEDGIRKYWFAVEVKMPPDDNHLGGGPKYLYFNPDGTDPNDKGVGHTFAQFMFGAHYKNSSTHIVSKNSTTGIVLQGDINYFNNMDGYRYIAQSIGTDMEIETVINFTKDIDNMIYVLTQEYPNKWETKYRNQFYNLSWEEFWELAHPYMFYGFDFNIATNISAIDLNTAEMYLFNSTGSEWFNVTDYFNITQQEENLVTTSLRDREAKEDFLSLVGDGIYIGDPIHPYDYNLTVKFNYTSSSQPFEVSFDEFTIDIWHLIEISSIQRFDPGINELYYPISASVNDTTGTRIDSNDLDALELNDGKYFIANSHTNNLTIDFEFNLVPYLDEILWNMDQFDYQYVFPNPVIPEITLRLSSNVSIDKNYPNHFINLSTALLEMYIGDPDFPYVDPQYKDLGWYPLWNVSELAYKDEFQIPATINVTNSWIILQLLNSTEPQKNLFKMRLRYEWNETQSPPSGGFNVTIDEFSFEITVQNAKSSDLCTLINYGMVNSALKPSNINLKVFGTNVTDNNIWQGYIADGTPSSDGTFEFDVTTNWEAISFDVTIEYTVFKYTTEIDFEDKIKTQYMTGTQYFSVEVTDDSGNELEDLELKFELLDSDGKVVDEDTAVTNDEGVAKGALKFDEVGEGYTIKVSFDEDSVYADEEIESDEFRIDNEFTSVMYYIILWSPFILIAIAVLVTYVTVRHRRLSKLRELWAKDKLTLEDLLKISYILIIHKDAGVTIYNRQISMELDSDLIGGFLTAISQFRSELKKDGMQKAVESGMEMDYYDFKIVMTDGDYARVALILDGIPSENLKANQWKFTRRFEEKFKTTLKDFTGDIRPFAETNQMVDQILNLSLMKPMQLGKHWELVKLNKLEKVLVEVAEQMQKERKFIFISSLLSYGLAGRKESRDQLISTIIGLKNREILVPVEIE